MSDGHQHPTALEPRELSSGSVMLRAQGAAPTEMSTRQGRVVLHPHDADAPVPKLTPIEHMLLALGSSLIEMLRFALGTEAGTLVVAVSQARLENRTVVTREILLERPLDDAALAALGPVLDGCPLSRMLQGPGFEVRTLVTQTGHSA
ncbi:MAG: hypothetical protein AAFZ18_31100 [Myxococcota bacterium]